MQHEGDDTVLPSKLQHSHGGGKPSLEGGEKKKSLTDEEMNEKRHSNALLYFIQYTILNMTPWNYLCVEPKLNSFTTQNK